MKLTNLGVPIFTSLLPLAVNANENINVTKEEQPNIIFILTDDMGYGDIGTYGGKFNPTPCLDRMADEGIKFYQYYSASPISSPSRAGLLTGNHPGRWHITSYLQSREGNRNAEMNDYLTIDAPSLPRAMKQGGYKTAHIGKWHLGGGRDVHDAPFFEKYGYDEFCSTYESPQPDPLLTATDWIWSPKDSIKRWERTAYFVDKTIDFLKINSEEPCFINLWPDDMHTPWVGDLEQQQEVPKDYESEKNFRSVLIEYDRQIGRLLEGIKDLKLDRETIVVFTSDNGPAPSFKGSRSGNMRGCKASLFEGGMHLPFIVWSSGDSVPRGLVDKTTVVSALDMFESLCSIANVDLPHDYSSDGMDISSALLGNPEKRDIPIFWEYRRNDSNSFPKPHDKDISPNLAIRFEEWKLLINDDGSNVMLFNLHDNLRETIEVSETYPEVTERLKSMLLEWRQSLPTYEEQ